MKITLSKKIIIISITENWFATSVAFSWIHDNIRYITYGSNLDANAKTILVQYA